MSALDERIAAGREEKAKAFARALWDAWSKAERLGLGLRKLQREPDTFWKELADSIGRRAPSPETRARILALIEIATRRERAKPTERARR